MRVVAAFVTSVALHAGIAALPAKYFPANTLDNSQTAVAPLQVRLHDRTPNTSGAETAPQHSAQTAELDAHADIAEPALGPARALDGEAAPPVAAFGIPLPRYYGPREVGERARPIEDIDLAPPVLQQFPGAGKVVLALYLNEEGTVDHVDLVSTELDSDIGDIIVAQFRKARFAPARIDGQPVRSKVKVEVMVKPPEIVRLRPTRATKDVGAGN
jgi:hypothetical protein